MKSSGSVNRPNTFTTKIPKKDVNKIFKYASSCKRLFNNPLKYSGFEYGFITPNEFTIVPSLKDAYVVDSKISCEKQPNIEKMNK